MGEPLKEGVIMVMDAAGVHIVVSVFTMVRKPHYEP